MRAALQVADEHRDHVEIRDCRSIAQGRAGFRDTRPEDAFDGAQQAAVEAVDAQLAWLHEFLEGVAAAAIGMTASVGFRTARSLLAVQRWPLVMIVAVFVAVGVLRWPLVPVAIVAGAAGLYVAWRNRQGAR
ncbi:hypothetical protein [Paraburkholderia sediminicola]|uniref:hypothetical protein n=1 Tax=Paraburkholderia sediminicola TaxID=458836 RepID=UPI0038B93DC7